MIIETPIKQRNVLPQFAIVDKQRVTQCLFNSRSKEKKTFSLTFIPGKSKSKGDLSWSVLLSTMATLHYSFLIASAC